MGKIVIFYKYVVIEQPELVKQWHIELCNSLELKGRIIIAHEGINATLGGTENAIDEYILSINKHPLFSGIDFKISAGDNRHFPRLKIMVKKEIVNLGIDPSLISAQDAGTHLSPEQVHNLLTSQPENLVILDARNSFESKVGHFQGAMLPEINYFRELPSYIDENLSNFENKQVLMYCTAGVRCERASAYLKHKGITQVYQLEGGIQRYVEEFPNGFFKGKNYVFDSRRTIAISSDILSTCDICATACDYYTNCMRASCNKHYISCQKCIDKLENMCSDKCHYAVHVNKEKKRPQFITQHIHQDSTCTL